MIFRTVNGKHYSREAGEPELLKSSSTEVQDSETLDNNLSLASQEEIVKHVTEMSQDIKCTVNEINLIKDRIFSIENEIKTLKLFPWFLLMINTIIIPAPFEVGHN